MLEPLQIPRPSAAGVADRPARPASPQDSADWIAFKRRYLAPEGRVVDTGNAGISHSEGQSYGMLFAVFHDDKPSFDQMWEWAQRTLRRPDDALLAWKYDPHATQHVPDQNNATDGDLLIAWALLRAALKWGEPRYADRAIAIARDILRLCVVDFVGRRVLLPGARNFRWEERIVVNPSYFAVAAFRALSRLVADASWAALEASSLDIVRAGALGRWRLPPDWCEISSEATIRPAPDRPARFSWDAIRIPVHLAWAGLREPAVEAAARFFFDGAHRFRPPAWADLRRDTISPYPGHAGVLAVAQFAAARSATNIQARRIALAEAPDYYGASLVLMTRMAAAEPPVPPAVLPELPYPPPPPPPKPPVEPSGLMASFRAYLGLPPAEPPPEPVSPLARLNGRGQGLRR